MANVLGAAWFLVFGLFLLAAGLRRDLFDRFVGRAVRMNYEAVRGSRSRLFVPKTYESNVKVMRAVCVVGGVLSLAACIAIVAAG